MNRKIVSLVLFLSLVTFVGACDQTGGGAGGEGGTESPAESPSPSPS